MNQSKKTLKKAVEFMVISTVSFTFLNIFVKQNSQFNVYQIVFFRSVGSLFFLNTRRINFGLIVLLATVLATRPYLLVMRCSTRKCQRVPSMGSDILSFPITLYQRGEKSQKLFRKETLYKLTWALWLVINL